MRRALALIPLVVAVSSLAAAAQSGAPKPYAPVAITRPAATADEAFTAFRARLAAVSGRRLYAELAALVAPQGFFWDRDFGNGFDNRKPAVDNLAAAVALEHDSGSGWRRLAEFAGEPASEPLESRPGVVCAPARPGYDAVAYSKLLDTSYTAAHDWAYPLAETTPVRTEPRPDAALAGTLNAAFVRLLGFTGPDSEPDPGRNRWARVALPDGRTGFVAPGGLRAITAERLCYIKDPVAGWQIAGFIAGGF